MKRFTETEKWRDPWFRSLPAPAKLVFFYFIDNCNNAGFHELDKELMVILTGMKPEHCEGALKALTRGIKGPYEGWYWIRRFLRHQKNDEINPENMAHKQIITLIKDQVERFKDCPEFQDSLAPLKGLLSPTGIGIGKGTGKEGGVQRGKFVPPDLEETKAYALEIQMPVADAESWYDHFLSNGWRVSGKTPMKDWKASLRNSKRNPVHHANGATPWQSAAERKQAEIDAANREYRAKKPKETPAPEPVDDAAGAKLREEQQKKLQELKQTIGHRAQ